MSQVTHPTPKRKRYIFKAIMSFLFVLLLMPLGHGLMILMEHYLSTSVLHVSAFIMGFVGLLITVAGVFIIGDTRQTICGLIGGLLFWTGWVEFIYQYYAHRLGVPPEMENGEIVTKPEYLLLPTSFGFWAMIMLMYLFSVKTGCNFINWWQRTLFRSQKPRIVARPMTRHPSIITFMELNMILWSSYLLLMFCYDKYFLGDHHPVTFLVGGACFVSSLFMFAKQLRIPSWGHNIRFSIATVIVFWTPVEILGRVDFFNEFWVDPIGYKWPMISLLSSFIIIGVIIYVLSHRRKPESRTIDRGE